MNFSRQLSLLALWLPLFHYYIAYAYPQTCLLVACLATRVAHCSFVITLVKLPMHERFGLLHVVSTILDFFIRRVTLNMIMEPRWLYKNLTK